MTKSLDKQLENSDKQKKIAENRLAAQQASRKGELLSKFDFTDPRYNIKKRNKPIERGRNQDTKLHPMKERLEGVSQARDVVRNSDLARAMMTQIVYNVVGKMGGKVFFHTGDDVWDKEASDWFWHDWATDCDGTGLLHYNVKLKETVASALTDGDIFWFVDDFTNQADGRLYTYSSDWLADPEDPENLEGWVAGYQSVGGLILSSRGRPLAACIGPERGVGQTKASNLQVYWMGDSAWLFKPWLCSPLAGWIRGVSAYAPSWLSIEGLKEMRAKELETAGVSASTLMKVLRKDGAETGALEDAGGDLEQLMELARTQANAGYPNASDETRQEAAETREEFEKVLKNYEQFESMKGARMEYLEEGEDIQPLDMKRPNLDTETYYNDVSRSAGSSIGMGDTYTKMKADRSYTAFRGEMLMTWSGLYSNLQKEVERDICDRVGRLAVGWAVEKGVLNPPPKGWHRRISHQWPQMPEVDPLKWITALGKEYGFGHKTPAHILGPDGDRVAADNRDINDRIFNPDRALEDLDPDENGDDTEDN